MTEIALHHEFDSLRQIDDAGREYWSSRAIAPLADYDRWENFASALDRAKATCENVGLDAADHFRDATKMVWVGSGASRHVLDVHLSRYGAYLVFMNGDPRKVAIAAAQTYFAAQTRIAETAAPVDITSISRRALAQMVIEAEDRADVLALENATLRPKADLADTFLTTAPGNRLVREVGKMLGWQEKALRTFLLEEKLVFVRHALCGQVQYDHRAEFAAHFRPVEKLVTHAWGECSHYTLTITPRGIDLIRKRIGDRQASVAAGLRVGVNA